MPPSERSHGPLAVLVLLVIVLLCAVFGVWSLLSGHLLLAIAAFAGAVAAYIVAARVKGSIDAQ